MDRQLATTSSSHRQRSNGVLKAYIINLAQARDRWARMEQVFAQTEIDLVRVEALRGADLTFPRDDYCERRYRLQHGKRTNPAEVGCYLSHLKAISRFLETDEPFALIGEDDLEITENLDELIESAMRQAHLWDILRLTGEHHGWPVPIRRLNDRYRLSVSFARRTAAGAYILSRHAAEILVDRLRPMCIPFDHALDREWHYGLRALSIDPHPIRQNLPELGTQINAIKGYRLPLWRRYWTVAPYRAANEVSRFVARLSLYAGLRLRGERPATG